MVATKEPRLPVAFGAQVAGFIHHHPANGINGHGARPGGGLF
jgi:hypothetical protein